jgi:hypothetical protein
MIITDKVNNSTNITTLTLYREGLFYKCYNEDAMIFVQKVKAYKVSAKFVKRVEANVYSIGFPVSEVEKGHLSFENISEKIGAKSYEIKDKHIVFLIENADAKRDYNEWTETIQEDKNVVAAKEPALVYEPRLDMDGIISMIKNYDLANSTPMQGLNFIQQLKSELYQIEKNNGNI